LVKLDRMTMAWSLEGRAPYLEPRLAELALALPDAWKGGENRRKRVLRDAVAPWLPPGIVDRAKQGFVLPMQSWLLGPLRDRLLDQLQGDHEDGLDLRIARRIAIDDLARGATRSRLLYGLLAYRAWSDRLREARSAQNSFADRVPSISSISGSREASQGRDGST
jgi:asparagine synthase (glutamine-hydrolysing)